MIWRTALSVTWRGDGATVARNVVVALAAAAVTLVACAATSAVFMVHGVNERAAARAFQLVESGETADDRCPRAPDPSTQRTPHNAGAGPGHGSGE